MQFIVFTYTINSINEWIVTTVAHGQPVAEEKQDIDVTIPENK